MARAHTETAINVLTGIMSETKAPHAARVAAASAVLDRGWGKPKQAIIGGDEDDPALKVINEIRRTVVDPRNPDSAGVPAAVDPKPV